jgi:RND superfamily putative drug exporter
MIAPPGRFASARTTTDQAGDPETGDAERPASRCGGPFGALGRFCYRHRRLVVGAWAVVLVLGAFLGTRVFGQTSAGTASPDTESARGTALVTAAQPYGAQVTTVVDDTASHGAGVADPTVRAAVVAAAGQLSHVPGVWSVHDAYDGTAGMRSYDGRASLIVVDEAKSLSDARATAVATSVADRLAKLSDVVPGLTVRTGGDQIANAEIGRQAQRDTEHGELISLPITLVVMVLIFGGFLAAGLPLLGAVGSIGGALLALFGFSKLMPLDPTVLPVATVLGLGLSIDYALLVVTRFREERVAGASLACAIERTCATAGRTIAFSALTVATSLSGLFVFVSPIFRAVAAAGVSVVVLACLAGLTLVPATLGFVGRRIRFRDKPVSDDGRFARLAGWVQRRAVLVVLGVTALLVLAGFPFLGANASNGGASDLPTSFQSRQVADSLASRFPGADDTPIVVVTRATPAAENAYADMLRALPGVRTVRPPQAVSDGLSTIDVVPAGAADGATAQRVVAELRGHRDGQRTWVTGDAASLVDFKHEVYTRGPWAVGLVAVATFVLLFLMTGSVLVPIKALVMNLLSLGASLGMLKLIFQDGWLHSLLGFTPTGGLETWIPVLVFALAFGLSMDYEVFLLARIKELHEQGMDSDRAVRLGIQRSGRVISSAAALMVVVFSGFASGSLLDVKEMGVALTIAVLVDATLVRGLLVPATMTLLGEANWWSPHPLRRLYLRTGLREHIILPPLRPQLALPRLRLPIVRRKVVRRRRRAKPATGRG